MSEEEYVAVTDLQRLRIISPILSVAAINDERLKEAKRLISEVEQELTEMVSGMVDDSNE